MGPLGYAVASCDKDLVRDSVAETLNELLEAVAKKVPKLKGGSFETFII